jgi:metal-responsive CopG/Arc/MetJ family transcriptional regulator
MISDNTSTQNRRGRPATGTNPAVGVRLPSDLMGALDKWRGAQPDIPSRPEAIRRLIEMGLKAAGGKNILP